MDLKELKEKRERILNEWDSLADKLIQVNKELKKVRQEIKDKEKELCLKKEN